MNCIDCEYSVNIDKNRQCQRANEDIRKCDNFKNAHRKIIHLDMDYEKEVKEMLE